LTQVEVILSPRCWYIGPSAWSMLYLHMWHVLSIYFLSNYPLHYTKYFDVRV
jgi:hypothetical protein